ncbi:MAG: polyribonucleotide nucleotidyltransferase [Chloroflexi bacterium]|nr:polyribonucleotide nucleotidyltransferase [Chloroflexota bacterium]
MIRTFTREIGGRTLTIEHGKLAGLAGGAVSVYYGDSMVVATVCTAKPREGIDFFPLTVDFEERAYAVGKIPGSFFRREGRPSQDAILTDRLTDRCLRPLFPKGFKDEVQVVVTVFSADQENPLDILSIIGASAALGISEIPFDGPVSATRVGYVNGELIVNPLFSQLDDSSLDLAVASTKDAVIMVEAGANEVPEKLLLEALRLGNKVNLELAELQDEIVRTVGKDKKSFEVPEAPAGLDSEVAGVAEAGLERLMDAGAAKGERNTAMDELLDQAVEKLGETYTSKDIAKAFDGLVKTVMRRKILDEGKRPDGRAPTEIRPITSEVGIVPRTHGSGLFTRGQTQVLALATLGSLAQTQRLDTLSPDDKKRFLHHYNFPSFSTGEVGRMGGPGRREIGHGSLAERALKPVIPSDSEFPYTIRLVSEVLSSNGSTSMASVCGSSMAMMDAGVPIKAPVAGVAMGLILGENGKFTVLTDIQGIEDFKGDMDFKVAGTVEGVNALQMDVKVKGITFEIMEQAMAQAREGRLFILDKMLQTISHPRETVSVYAPKIKQIKIPQEKIGGVIGPGGRTIRAIIEQTHATIDVEDDGTVTIGAVDEESMRKAIATVEGLVKEAEVGQVYTGKVVRIMDFGAFVEILPGKDGLVHISQLADYHVDRVEDEVKVGDEVTVVVTEVDRLGRVNLSRRAVSTSSDDGGESGDRPRPSDDSGRNGPPRRSGDGPRDRGPRPPRRY